MTMSSSKRRVRSCSLVDTSPDLEGFLTKRGGFVKNWKRRWCTLKYGVLRYYPSLLAKKPLKTLYLGAAEYCEVCQHDQRPAKASPFCFMISYPPHRRIYYFCAISKEEMHLWVAAVQGYLKNNGPKDEEELERRMARAYMRSPTSNRITSGSHDDEDDETETMDEDEDDEPLMRMKTSSALFSKSLPPL